MGMTVRKVRGWGWFGVGVTQNGVARVILPQLSKRAVIKQLKAFDDGINQRLSDECADLLEDYLRGKFVSLDNIPIDWRSLPPIFRRILQTLRETVSRGQVITYGELARRCGIPRGARLVGQAMAKNPLPLLVPCHRVVRADGRVGGFSSGALLKVRLLTLEHSGTSTTVGDVAILSPAKISHPSHRERQQHRKSGVIQKLR
ncbi:MAG: hypothetical protein C4295_07645 [Candidatus Fervidibacterota bacterium]